MPSRLWSGEWFAYLSSFSKGKAVWCSRLRTTLPVLVQSASTIDVASCSGQSTGRPQGLNPCYREHVGVRKRVRPTEIGKEFLRQLARRTLVTEDSSDPGNCNLQL